MALHSPGPLQSSVMGRPHRPQGAVLLTAACLPMLIEGRVCTSWVCVPRTHCWSTLAPVCLQAIYCQHDLACVTAFSFPVYQNNQSAGASAAVVCNAVCQLYQSYCEVLLACVVSIFLQHMFIVLPSAHIGYMHIHQQGKPFVCRSLLWIASYSTTHRHHRCRCLYWPPWSSWPYPSAIWLPLSSSSAACMLIAVHTASASPGACCGSS